MQSLVAQLLQNTPDTQSFVICTLAVCLLVFVWRVLPRMADHGAEYIKEFGAYRLAMYELKHPHDAPAQPKPETPRQIPSRSEKRSIPSEAREVDQAA